LGWKAKTTFKELVQMMVLADLDRWKKKIAGESFPWDAPNYPQEMEIVSRYLVKDSHLEAAGFEKRNIEEKKTA